MTSQRGHDRGRGQSRSSSSPAIRMAGTGSGTGSGTGTARYPSHHTARQTSLNASNHSLYNNRSSSNRVTTQPSAHARPTPEQSRADQVRNSALIIATSESQITTNPEALAWAHLASVSSPSPSQYHIQSPMDPDAMDIDTPQNHQQATQSLYQVASAGISVPRGYIGNNQVFRHTFQIQIRSPVQGHLSDLEVLRTARARIRSNPQASVPPSYAARAVGRTLVLRIIIDSLSISRHDALVLVDWRLHFMIEMIEDREGQGLGWFCGLPWVSDHFQVRLVAL